MHKFILIDLYYKNIHLSYIYCLVTLFQIYSMFDNKCDAVMIIPLATMSFIIYPLVVLFLKYSSIIFIKCILYHYIIKSTNIDNSI